MGRRAYEEKARRAALRASQAVPALQPVPERRQSARIAAQDRAAEVQAELHEGGAMSSTDVCADVLMPCAGTDALDEPLDESAAPVLPSRSERRRFDTKAARKVVAGDEDRTRGSSGAAADERVHDEEVNLSHSGRVKKGATRLADVPMPSPGAASAVDQEVVSALRSMSSLSCGVHVREDDNPAKDSVYRKRDGKIIEKILAGGSLDSKCFTPSTIDETRCLARVWGGGRGDQCRLKPGVDELFLPQAS